MLTGSLRGRVHSLIPSCAAHGFPSMLPMVFGLCCQWVPLYVTNGFRAVLPMGSPLYIPILCLCLCLCPVPMPVPMPVAGVLTLWQASSQLCPCLCLGAPPAPHLVSITVHCRWRSWGLYRMKGKVFVHARISVLRNSSCRRWNPVLGKLRPGLPTPFESTASE